MESAARHQQRSDDTCNRADVRRPGTRLPSSAKAWKGCNDCAPESPRNCHASRQRSGVDAGHHGTCRCHSSRSVCGRSDMTHATEEHTTSNRRAPLHAPRGTSISCKGWQQEAAMRMLMNNLDPDVAERPDDLIVYGGSGKAARNWESFDAIVRSLQSLEHDETLLIQSGKPVGVFQTHPGAPRVLIANALLVPAWATWENFRDLEHRGLTMYGQMTAGSWIYIGSQGIVQGTYETLAAIGRRHFGGTLSGKLVVTAGLGGMGGAQPLAASMNGAAALVVEVDPQRIARRVATRYLDESTTSVDEALGKVRQWMRDGV